MDIDSALKRIIKTGKIKIGVKQTMDSLLSGSAKAIVISSNCPLEKMADLKKYSALAKVPMIKYPGPSLQLGELCGKPFLVSSIAILDLGAIGINELKKTV